MARPAPVSQHSMVGAEVLMVEPGPVKGIDQPLGAIIISPWAVKGEHVGSPLGGGEFLPVVDERGPPGHA